MTEDLLYQWRRDGEEPKRVVGDLREYDIQEVIDRNVTSGRDASSRAGFTRGPLLHALIANEALEDSYLGLQKELFLMDCFSGRFNPKDRRHFAGFFGWLQEVLGNNGIPVDAITQDEGFRAILDAYDANTLLEMAGAVNPDSPYRMR